jgi:hypothetical protein
VVSPGNNPFQEGWIVIPRRNEEQNVMRRITTRIFGDPSSNCRRQHPLLSPRGGQTEYSWVVEKTLVVKPPARSGRGSSWEVPPTRFQWLCHFVPHDKRPPDLSTCVRFWAASAHTAWARMENKVTTSTAREGGREPAFPACHSTTTTAAALC